MNEPSIADLVCSTPSAVLNETANSPLPVETPVTSEEIVIDSTVIGSSVSAVAARGKKARTKNAKTRKM